MSTETPVAPQSAPAPAATPATPATTATPAAPSTNWDNFKISDQQFKDAGFSDADLQQAKAATEAPPVQAPASTPTPVSEKPTDDMGPNFDAVQEALKQEPTAPAPTAPPPALTPDQMAVLRLMPNADMAAMSLQGLDVVNSFGRGNTPEFLNKLQQVNPNAFQQLAENLYQTLMPQWVDRYIAENDPNANPMSVQQNRRLDQIERERAEEKQAFQNWRNQQDQERRYTAVTNELSRLFQQAKFTDANGFTDKDRAHLTDAIMLNLVKPQNKAIWEKAWTSNPGAVFPIFQEHVKDFIDSERTRAEKLRATAQKQQETKKPPLQAAGVSTTESTAKGWDAAFERARAFVAAHQ